MPIYLLAYHGVRLPNDDNDQAWDDWMLSLGGALEGSNNPIVAARTIGADGEVADGGGANPVEGLSFVTADDFDEAVQIALGCPHLAAGGSIEVAEIAARHRS